MKVLSVFLKISLLCIAIVMMHVSYSKGYAGAAAGALMMLSGAVMLCSKGLGARLSSAEAVTCVALVVGMVLGSIPYMVRSCSFQWSFLQWLIAVILTYFLVVAVANYWRPRIVLNTVKTSKWVWGWIGLVLFFGVLVSLRPAEVCGGFSMMPGLVAGLFSLAAFFFWTAPRKGE